MHDKDGNAIKTDNWIGRWHNKTNTMALNYYIIHNKSQILQMAAHYVIIIRYKAISIEYYDNVSFWLIYLSSKMNPNFKVWFNSKLYALIPLFAPHCVGTPLDYLALLYCLQWQVVKKMHSRIPLIHHPQEQRGVKLPYIMAYQTVPTMI